jgi:serine phosphatase RsbU (regulator of sigma subunit)
MLGEDRLRAAFAAAAAGSPGDTLRSIRRLLHEWTGRDRQDDDVSIVVLKVRGPRDVS